MTRNRGFSVARLAAVTRAEFLMVWASRIPLVVLGALPVGVYLFVFELYHIERIGDHLPAANALDVLPVLFAVTWKTLLFQASIAAFAAFWTTVDSQYGMIRVACCQPVTRVEYLAGKWAGIMAHVVLLTVALVAAEAAWSAVYSGLDGVRGQDVASLARFGAELVGFVAAIASIAMALASVRRTVGAGIVIALMGFVLLGFMTMLPWDVVAPRHLLMRYFFFPLGELPDPFPHEADSFFRRVYSLSDFLRVACLTPLAFLLPAVLYFRKRDISE